MKKPTAKKSLKLAAETLRTLADDTLPTVGGAAMANNTFGVNCYSKKSECWGCP